MDADDDPGDKAKECDGGTVYADKKSSVDTTGPLGDTGDLAEEDDAAVEVVVLLEEAM